MSLLKLGLVAGGIVLASAIKQHHAEDDELSEDQIRDAFLGERIAELRTMGIDEAAAARIAGDEWERAVVE